MRPIAALQEAGRTGDVRGSGQHSMAHDLPFDTVALGPAGAVKRLTTDEFLALPFERRVKAILGGDLVFLRAGTVVPTPRALQSLRQREVAEVPAAPLAADHARIRVEWRDSYVLAIHFEREVDDREFRSYLARIDDVIDRRVSHVALTLCGASWCESPHQREMHTTFLAARERSLRSLCRASAFVLPAGVRATVGSKLLLHRLPMPHALFEHEADALEWLARV
jgi:hypothetical protein